MKVKELEQHATPKQIKNLNDNRNLNSNDSKMRLQIINPVIFNTFPIYNPLELTCFVKNYCLTFLSTRRNLQAFQVGRRKCEM